MPLSGLIDGERVVSCLLSDEQWATLKDDVREKRRTITMPCGWRGMAKTSQLGTQYFAHAPGGDGCSAGESAQHLRAKAVIVEAVSRAGWIAATEVPGDGWVADVMATKGGVRVVFEVQWSRQNLSDYRLRQERYLDSGIASVAWFARHVDGLPESDKQLPIFGLEIDDEGETTAVIGTATISLAQAVDRLLNRRLQHRDYVASGRTALAEVDAGVMDCYRCHESFGVWRVRQTVVEGLCGCKEARRLVPRVFAQNRPEALPEIRVAGESLSRDLGVAPGRIFRRRTQAAGKHYMAFTCPHCNATCGDMFVVELFENGGTARSDQTQVSPSVIPLPHWCLAGDEGPCPIPPPGVIAEYERLYAPDRAHDPAEQTTVDHAHVGHIGSSSGIPIHQALGRMFGRR